MIARGIQGYLDCQLTAHAVTPENLVADTNLEEEPAWEGPQASSRKQGLREPCGLWLLPSLCILYFGTLETDC
jgi:hypothetical protein